MNKYLLAFFVVVSMQSLFSKGIVDCRVMTGAISDCNPYGRRLYYAKKVTYDVDRQKLIIEKTLPLPKRGFVHIVSVEDMVERYVKVEDSMRFKRSADSGVVHNTSLPEKKDIQKKVLTYIIYSVRKGDSLNKIAKKFGLTSKSLATYNGIRQYATLKIGKKLKLALEPKMMKSLMSEQYEVEEHDTLLSIAKKFNLSPKLLVQANNIKDATMIRKGKILKLPFNQKRENEKQKRLVKKKKSSKLDLRTFGKHKLRVTATAYSSHGNQTDSTPFLAAWNNRLRPGMKIIAVSRDMLTRYGMRNGTKVRIGGLRGFYRVRDKMNKRYRKRIDIYMGLDLRRALKWGRRSVVIYW